MKRIVLACLVLSCSIYANAKPLSIVAQIDNACAKALSGDKHPLGHFPPDSFASTVSPKVKDAYNEILKAHPSIVNDQSSQNATSCANLVKENLKAKGEYPQQQ
ncbi:hypothetical protein M8013_22445 [Enterobacteriaceae bacterium H4N4]|uniref:Uncharacterized protein n=1 Tax=Silvania confinis TaxID=2926470 RepID=A0A9J6QKV0_9ENTR|nr:hypothetical protein [Silvania confinis]MCU6671484.1 hypothetical protein [Silvania confinis]